MESDCIRKAFVDIQVRHDHPAVRDDVFEQAFILHDGFVRKLAERIVAEHKRVGIGGWRLVSNRPGRLVFP